MAIDLGMEWQHIVRVCHKFSNFLSGHFSTNA
jgi:hypothetical protein